MTQKFSFAAHGWSVALAALGINLVLGVLYAWSVMGRALVTEWQWTKTQAALPFTVATISFSVMMIFAGRMQDKIGPRFIVMSGGLLLGLGLIGSSFTRSPAMILLTFGVLGGIGIGLGYSSTTPPAIKWFPPHRKGLITGIVVSGSALAATYISPLSHYLLLKTGISQTFLTLGIGTVIAVGILSQLLADPPREYAEKLRTEEKSLAQILSPVSPREHDWHEMLRTSRFYQLWTIFILGASAGLMIIAHIAIIAKEQANWEWGFMLVMLVAIFNAAGRVVGGFLSDLFGRAQTLAFALVAQAVNMFAFAHYTSPLLLIIGSAFAGLCYGTIFSLMPAATADFYGVNNLGVNYGLVFTAFGVAGIFGPLLGGRIRDLSGSYATAYIIAAVMLLLGAILAFIASFPHKTSSRLDVKQNL